MANFLLQPFNFIFDKIFGIKVNMTEFIIVIYFALITCNNKPVFLYTGFIILMIALFYSMRTEKLRIPKTTIPLILLVFYWLLSSLWAWEPEQVFAQIRTIAVSVVLVIVLSNYLIRKKSVDIMFIMLAVAGEALAIYLIMTYGGLGAFYNAALGERARLGRDISNTNRIGMMCAYSAMIYLYYFLAKKRVLCAPLIILPVLVSISTGSRKALLILIIGCFAVILMSQYGKKGFGKYLIIFALLSAALIGIVYLSQTEYLSNVSERMDSFMNLVKGNESDADGSSLMRRELIRVGLAQFQETPILGIGLGNSFVLNYRKLRFFAFCHNDYIEILVNGGIIGFLLYYGVYIYMIIQYLRLIKQKINDYEIVLSFIFMIIFLIMNAAAVSSYTLATFFYLSIWISIVEMYKREGYLDKNKVKRRTLLRTVRA